MIQDAIWVQKLDLKLRNEFPGLKTKIGQPEKHKYVIHCMNHTGIFDRIQKYIDDNRMLGLWITSTTEQINEKERLIPSLDAHDVPNNMKGNLITKPDIWTYLTTKFQDVEFWGLDAHPGIDFYLTIYVNTQTTDNEVKAIEHGLIDAGVGTDDIRVIRKPNSEVPDSAKEVGKYVTCNSFHIKSKTDLPFIKHENEYWHENALQIFEGNIKKEDLPYYGKEKSKSYLDFTHFDNINLRNTILLYDEVYIGLPIEKNLDRFYSSQEMTSDELLKLIEMGRVKVLLTENESSYNKNLLNDIYACNPASIVGQRGINALLAILLTELEKSHRKHNPHVEEIAEAIFSLGIEENDSNALGIANLLKWPLRAKLDFMDSFVNFGPSSIGDLGMSKFFSLYISNTELLENINFEFTVNSLRPCIAASLDATYFPFIHDGIYTDATVSNGMSDLFKFYRHDLQTFKRIKDGMPVGGEYELRLLQVTDDVSIVKFAELAQKENTPVLLGKLLKKLDSLEPIQQKQAIMDYNHILMDFTDSLRKHSASKTDFLLGIGSMLPCFPQEVNIFFGLLGLIRTTDIIANNSYHKKLKKILEKYENENLVATSEDIQLLDHMSVAVRLRRI